MNKYDLLEAMSGIREEYIADAAAASELGNRENLGYAS